MERWGGCVVLELAVEPSFELEKAVCSHGLFMMAPNRWDPTTRSLCRPLRLASSPSTSLPVRISHPSPTHPLLVSVFGPSSLSHHDQQSLLAQVRRMLRISADNDRMLREFHRMHDGAQEKGFGRIFRSPTLFEDMVKCILLCNCQWPRTLLMARELCNLQQELKSCSASEDFKPKTPQPRELKRKRGKRKKVVMKLEAKFMENRDESAEDKISVMSHKSQNNHPQWKDLSSCTSSHVFIKDTSITVHQLSNDMSSPSYQTGDFPSPEELAALDVDFVATRCKLGYRTGRIISLAKSIVENKIELSKLEKICDGSILSSYDELDRQLSGISGFGPFTRANVLMCMGFYNRIPADTETIRHLKQFHARKNCSIRSVNNDIEEIYGKYAQFQFLAYWSELWGDYEQRFGKMSEMPPSDYHLITACNMKKKDLNWKVVGGG